MAVHVTEKSFLEEPVEEELIRLLKFAPIKKIRDIILNNPSLNLHYPTNELKTPLTITIDRGDPQILALLIEKIPTNLDSTTTQPCGKSALMHASYYSRNIEILQVLLKKGADPEKKDLRGWNSLWYAVIGKRIENAIFLLDSGACIIDSKDEIGRTPLMISVFMSTFDIFCLLLERGANVNEQDNLGFTALQLAILRRKRDCVITLMEKGIDFNTRSPRSNITVFELAEELMSDILPAVRSKRRCLKIK